MNTTSSSRPLADTTAMLGDLIEQGARLSIDLLTSLSRSDPMAAMGQLQGELQNQMQQMRRMMGGLFPTTMPQRQMGGGCGCQIPPPCWAPQSLGEVTSHVCPGAAATIRLRITNCGPVQRAVKIEAVGKTAGVTVTPAGLTIGPMERAVVVASVNVPADAPSGQEQEILLWVRGCQNHYLRWTVNVAARGISCCHEVEVSDCPDLVHHWYDHFYCGRQCFSNQIVGREG